jgi:hypothetical protein
LANGKFWLLATPYSRYPHGHEAAYWLAVETRGFLLRSQVPCFSPIVHSHPICHHCGFDVHDIPFWLLSEGPIRAHAHGMIFLLADGWRESYGMGKEREEFEALGRPVVEMRPFELPPGLVL